jgi:hypothetical protein
MLMEESPSLLRPTLWWKLAGELSIRIAALKSAGNFADKIREAW